MDLLDLIFPKKCLQCGKSGKYICKNCAEKVKVARQICVECQKPAIDGITHIGCHKPLGLDGVLAGFEYKWVMKKAIKSLKYRFAREVAQEVSFLMLRHLKSNINALPKDLVLIPIPLHKKRQNWRGFNQAEELGKIIAGQMKWKFIPNLIIRVRQSTPQAELKGEERRKNVQGIFQLNPKFKYPVSNINSLVIFDDVFTTGATMREAAKVIKRKNKDLKIWGLAVAR